jgi:undecaprenyl-diphosphatase
MFTRPWEALVDTTHTTDVSGPWRRRRGDAIAAVAGLLVLAVGMVLVRNSSVSDFEEDVFRAINDLPEALYPVAWPFQQVGALVAGPIVAIVAALLRKYRLAVAALIVTASKLVLERLVKAMVTRERPGTSIGTDIEARGDVSISGESFVSGHAILVTALAGVVAPYLPGRWKLVPWIIAALVAFGRVYVGAHNPLDVICGAGLGLAIASVTNLALGVPADTGARDDMVAER